MVFTVPMWGSEVANCETDIHRTNTTTSEVMLACNVTTIEHEGDFTSLGICYLRGNLVNRTYGEDKNIYIHIFLPTIFGPIYYRPQ